MIRFYNGKVMKFGSEITLTDEEVWTDGENISYVGPAPEEYPEFERQIDLKGDVLMPGFKNAHAHTAMVFLRSLSDKKPLQQWLEDDCFPNEALLTDEDIYWLTKIGIMEYLSSGITAAFDMYFHNDAVVAASAESGFRTVICASLNNFDADITNIEREYLKFNSLNSLISYRLGIHAEYTTSIERMEYIVSLAEKYKAPCFTHLCETKSETEGCHERYGISPVKLLDDLGFFRYGGGACHCCYFTEEDMDLFASKGLYAVTCPSSNLKLASGIAPIEKMRRKGIRLAIGTDGAGSNNALDFFREMYLVSVLQNILEGRAAAFPVETVLEMACVNGAALMGLDKCTGIEPGNKADLLVIDMSRPNMRPVNLIVPNIVYSGSKENVRMTMVNGKVLYENGEFFIGESTERIYTEAQKFSGRMKKC